MKANLGNTDRVIRIMTGVVLICGGLMYRSPIGLIGIVFIATAALGFCPLYSMLGIRTRKLQQN